LNVFLFISQEMHNTNLDSGSFNFFGNSVKVIFISSEMRCGIRVEVYGPEVCWESSLHNTAAMDDVVPTSSLDVLEKWRLSFFLGR
jgi:hypothetical protein